MQERSNSYQRMPFLKIYSREWLQGSLRIENDAAERGVWADFLALSNESRKRGIIQANDITPYPHEYLASLLNIPVDLLEHCIAKFTAQGRISEDGNGIKITNFDYWQGLDTKRKGPGRPPKNREKRKNPEGELSESLKEIMRCHDEYIGGLINSVKSAKITDFSEFFDNNGGKIEWIEKGFAAAPASKRQWDYIQAILQRYLDNGGPDDREKTNQSSRRSGPQQRTRQPRRHPITYIKGSDPADG